MKIATILRRALAVVTISAVVTIAAFASFASAADNGSSEGGSAFVDGLAIYLGVLPSDIIAKGYGKNTPEYKMEQNAPRGAHFHHVLVAIYDQKTGERVTNADVTATVREVGSVEYTKKMEPFDVAGAMTYCNYFNMPTLGWYRIELTINRPGLAAPIKATLQYDHVVGN